MHCSASRNKKRKSELLLGHHAGALAILAHWNRDAITVSNSKKMIQEDKENFKPIMREEHIAEDQDQITRQDADKREGEDLIGV